MAFDVNAALVKLNGRTDYLPVKARLQWFREQHPDGDIETDQIRLDDQIAVFKARVSIPGGGSATGHGSETFDDFRDYIEKSETKAVGRALAALGYGTQFAPEFEEGVGNQVDAGVDRLPAGRLPLRSFAAAGPGGPSEKQLGAIRTIGRRLGLTEQDLVLLASFKYDADALEKLSGGREGSASRMIDWLANGDKDEVLALLADLQVGKQSTLLAAPATTVPPRESAHFRTN